MKPIFKIGDHNYTAWLAADGLAPVRNDLDADGSGRDIQDCLMRRKRIGQKDKWAVKFLRMPELVMQSLAQDMDHDYVFITILDPDTNRHVEKEFYSSTFTYGTQRYLPYQGLTVYDNCTFDITER